MGAILADSELVFLAISSDKFTIFDTLTPAAGSNSFNITTGPLLTFFIFPSTPKSSKIFSKNSGLNASLLLVFSMNSFALTLDDPNDWRGVTDQVMGGKSVLSIDHEDGIFYMKGTVTTANNGGFVRLSKRIDIKDNSYKGVTFKAKGNIEQYELHVTLKGVKMPPWSYLSSAFDVTSDWQEYQIAFADLQSKGYMAASMRSDNIRDISIAGYGRDFDVDLAIKDIALY